MIANEWVYSCSVKDAGGRTYNRKYAHGDAGSTLMQESTGIQLQQMHSHQAACPALSSGQGHELATST